ncbi:uncharacterized protein METZ01_LOCUS242496, partial [marine metagenome]
VPGLFAASNSPLTSLVSPTAPAQSSLETAAPAPGGKQFKASGQNTNLSRHCFTDQASETALPYQG